MSNPKQKPTPLRQSDSHGSCCTKDAAGFIEALNYLDVEISLEERSQVVEVRSVSNTPDGIARIRGATRVDPNPDGWFPLTDTRASYLMDQMAMRLEIHDPDAKNTCTGKRYLLTTAGFWRTVDAVCHQSQHNSVLDWLLRLPPWDRTARLPTLFQACYGAEDTRLNEWAGIHFFVATVGRALQPGCQVDWTLLLVGPHLAGKSLFPYIIIPEPWRDYWHTDNVDLSQTPKERAESTGAAWIREIAELSGMSRADIDRVKADISRRSDRFRPSYGRTSAFFRRAFNQVATANENPNGIIHNDRALWRRFLPVQVSDGYRKQMVDYINANLSQLWAEGLARYQAQPMSTAWSMPPEIVDDVLEIMSGHAYRNEIMETSVDAIDLNYDNPAGYTLGELAVKAKLVETVGDGAAKLPRAKEMELSRALSDAGWIKQRTMARGRRAMRWFPPGDWEIGRNYTLDIKNSPNNWTN